MHDKTVHLVYLNPLSELQDTFRYEVRLHNSFRIVSKK